MTIERRPEDLATTLRRNFDRGFAEALEEPSTTAVDLLAIRVADVPYAIALADVAGLHAGRRVVRVPSGTPSFLGIASFKGALWPVFDLRLLLGHPSDAAVPRWLVLLHGARPTALAFDHFESHLRVRAEDVLPPHGRGPGQGATLYVRGLVYAAELALPLLDVVAIASKLAGKTKEPAPIPPDRAGGA
jgi:chemotaxis signal transduction protein